MKKIVLGTAGHIDHGKTSLIRAMTGIDCDRLKEEKTRGITTELGFASYRLSDTLRVGIVDVPGHEKFIRHMVAGAWGIDMVLLVVAADEGVMPQTREHLDICELLGLKNGIVVITKKDLVDSEMLELVTDDIQDFLAGRTLEGAPIIAVSSATGENLESLREAIETMASHIDDRSRKGVFRLPVDRVFSLKGMGTVVTGTCISGEIRTGDEVEFYPLGKRARIRNIQVYHEDTHEALAGQRVALNLQGLEKDEITRGTIAGRPGSLLPTTRVDCSFRYLKVPLKPVRNDTILRFHIATTQEEARMVLLSRDSIEPGEELFAQFVFKNPIVTVPGDRFVLRGPYMVQTIGGGTILDIAPQRHARKSPDLDGIYALLLNGSEREKVEFHIRKGGFGGRKLSLLSTLLGMDEPSLRQIVALLSEKHRTLVINKTIVIHTDLFTQYKQKLIQVLTAFHKQNPQKIGMSKEELRTRLPSVEPVVFQTALDAVIAPGTIIVEKDRVMLTSARSAGDSAREGVERTILTRLRDAGYAPPSVKDLAGELSKDEKYTKDVLERMAFTKMVVRVKNDLYFHGEVIEALKVRVTDYLKKHGEMAPTDFKAEIEVSRKYLIPLLEYLDQIKLTIRSGEKRVLRAGTS